MTIILLIIILIAGFIWPTAIIMFLAFWFASFLVFGFIPTGTLILFLSIAYSFWWMQAKQKTWSTVSILFVIGTVAIIILYGVIPIISYVPGLSYIFNIVSILLPMGADHAWFINLPTIIAFIIPFSIFAIIVAKVLYSTVSTLGFWKREDVKKDVFLGFAKLNAFLGIISLVVVLINMGIPIFQQLIYSNFITTIIFELLFAYIPFITFYFFLDFAWSRIYRRGDSA